MFPTWHAVLSAYGEPKLVMTGIKYGACDYLLKAVRIQELQNIWQHVVRRNKSIILRRPASSPNDGSGRAIASSTSNGIRDGRSPDETSAGDQENGGVENKDHDGHDSEENANDDENEQEPATQKKPRLFWSHELHQKFIDAVTNLGLDSEYLSLVSDNLAPLSRLFTAYAFSYLHLLVMPFAEAFPKKILDLMNVEGLTREQVASHLQVQILALKKKE